MTSDNITVVWRSWPSNLSFLGFKLKLIAKQVMCAEQSQQTGSGIVRATQEERRHPHIPTVRFSVEHW